MAAALGSLQKGPISDINKYMPIQLTATKYAHQTYEKCPSDLGKVCIRPTKNAHPTYSCCRSDVAVHPTYSCRRSDVAVGRMGSIADGQ